MLKVGMNRGEIEKELGKEGDYVQIHDLRRFIAENLPIDIKKFACQRLVEVYERRNMPIEAVYLYDKLAEMSMPPEKNNYLLKEIEHSVKSGSFEKADAVLLRILTESKAGEKLKIISSVREFYKKQAEAYEKEKRRSKAVEVYEKLLVMKDVAEPEKSEINRKLLGLYKELGMVDKYLGIKEGK